jgi:hypothetical protein
VTRSWRVEGLALIALGFLRSTNSTIYLNQAEECKIFYKSQKLEIWQDILLCRTQIHHLKSDIIKLLLKVI